MVAKVEAWLRPELVCREGGDRRGRGVSVAQYSALDERVLCHKAHPVFVVSELCRRILTARDCFHDFDI